MKELLLLGFGIILTVCTYGQGVSIAELESAAMASTTEVVSSESTTNFPIIGELPTSIKKIESNSVFQFPIAIKEVPKTIYWEDRLGDKVETGSAQISTKRKSNPINNPTSNSITNSITNSNSNDEVVIARTGNKIEPMTSLMKTMSLIALSSNKSNLHFYELPFGIQQVNRTIYLTDKLEAYYAAKQKSANVVENSLDADKKVVDRIEQEVVAVNATTSATTSRRGIISKRELKAIVRRANGKKDDYREEAHTKPSSINSLNKTKVRRETGVKTIIASNVHHKPANDHSATVAAYKPAVVSRELAVLEKMMSGGHAAVSSAPTSNPNIPVTTQPLEVTSEIINGESVITEIKPINEVSVSSVSESTPAPYMVAGEKRSIRADHFSKKTVDNELINSDQLKGKVVVYNFWFTTCVECIREVPHLNELQDRYVGQDVEFLGVCLNGKSDIESFLKKHSFEWKQIPDGRDIAHNFYMFMYPGHAVVDKDGGVITLLNGNEPAVMSQLESAIQVGLGERF